MDMDGTLTNFNLKYMEARRSVLRELENLNLRTLEFTELSSISLMLASLKNQVDPFRFIILRRKLYNILEEMELEGAKEATLYPGAYQTLQNLRQRSLKLGIATNNGRAGTDLTLRRINLESFFNAVVTRDDCENMKPDGEPIKKVLEKMDAHRDESILVGDGVMDIMAAKAVALPSAAVATGPFTNERLLGVEPDYLLGSINDLPSLIEKLESSS